MKVKDICNEKCVYEHKDGTVTFDKRILVTTKVLDNGINIKDKKVKHIFLKSWMQIQQYKHWEENEGHQKMIHVRFI